MLLTGSFVPAAPRARPHLYHTQNSAMARRKITEGELPDDDDLPELTPQQMKFVEGIASGKTASDAFRAAYDTSNYSANALWVDASRAKNHPKVRLWLDAIQAAGFTKVSCTRDEHLSELERLRNKAERTGNIGAAVQAEQLRGKVAGHYVEKVEHSMGDNSAAERLRKIAESSPELADMAKAIAAKHGLDLKTENATRH